jgi:hypothetical protein
MVETGTGFFQHLANALDDVDGLREGIVGLYRYAIDDRYGA